MNPRFARFVSSFVLALCVSLPCVAQQKQPPKKPSTGTDCSALPDYGKLKQALTGVIKEGKEANTGLGNQEWAVVVNRDGIVCAVTFSGPDRGAQWPGSRIIAAEKANTANALSLDNFALSTANLYAAAQPGQSLYGLATSAPPNPVAVFGGSPEQIGQPNDAMVGKAIGGIIVFGGGLPLYDQHGKIVGGLGVSGDTACADHIVAWKVRDKVGLNHVPMGVAPDQNDNMILDIGANGQSASGFGHPSCKGGKPSDEAIKSLAQKYPTKAQ
jgi:uncharacterized protein GlcG (DUF336 family)